VEKMEEWESEERMETKEAEDVVGGMRACKEEDGIGRDSVD
jgi:hypothetical protein